MISFASIKFAAESGPNYDCGEDALFLSYRRSTLLAGKTARLRPNFVTSAEIVGT